MIVSNIDTTHLLGFALLLLGFKILWEIFFSPLRVFPGPILAKFTDVYRAVIAAQGHADKANREWHKKYGSAVRVGPNAVIFNDTSLIKTFYSSKKPWTKSGMYAVNDIIAEGKRISNIFNTPDHAWHAQQLKPINKFFSMSRLRDVEPFMDETINKFTAKLDKRFVAASGSECKVCMMEDWLAYLAWDTMANVAFGRHYGFLDQEGDVEDMIADSTKALKYFAPVCQIPWLDNLLDKNPIIRIGPKPMMVSVLYAARAIAEYKQGLSEKKESQLGSHFLDKYLKLEEQYPGMVNDTQLVNWLLPLVAAGGDTTAATLCAVVYYLAKNEGPYEKLRYELDRANLTTPAQWKDLKDLTYLDAIIREALRVCPGVALAPERLVPEGGYALPDGRFMPAGTKVGLNPAVTNRDSSIFGDDVDDFIPERWLKRDGEPEEEFNQRFQRMHDVLDFTFGAGTRVCLGKNLARMEVYKVTATLYSLYDIHLVDPKHEWNYRNSWFVYQQDIPMRISRRTEVEKTKGMDV
ncbi:hypothetical protein ACJ41O_003923 [Fusarium nematophilum]